MRTISNFLSRFPFLLVIPLAFILTTCKKDDPKPPDEQEVIIAPITKILSPVHWDQYLIAVDSAANWTLHMDPAVRGLYDLKVGDIVVSGAGEGLLRRITAISEVDGELRLETTQAAVTEALQKADFQFQKNLNSGLKEAAFVFHHEGVRIDTSFRSAGEAQLELELELPIIDEITVTGTLTLDPSINGAVTIEDYTLIYMKMEFVLQEQFEITTTATLANYTLEKEIKLVTITFPTFTVMVGAFPVIVTPEFTLYLGANLDLKSQLSVGVTQELTVTAGLEYESGTWDPYYEVENEFGRTGPSLSNTMEAKAYIKPQLNMKFYGMVSPYLAMELYGLVEAELNATPWWELYAGLKTSIGIEIKIWILNIASFSATLFDWKMLIADSQGTGNQAPKAAFVITPDQGTTATTFQFDATGSFDAEDPPGALQVRWDWEGDGSWDTPFSTEKIAFHKYDLAETYHPVLQVKDTFGATDDSVKTLVVVTGVNQPPVAHFTVNPPTGPHTQVFQFDASTSSDEEDPLELLRVRWDWENDGYWDTPLSEVKTATHQFNIGFHQVMLEVADTEGLTDTISVMVHVFDGNPTSFITDPRDGKIYATVQIGDQWWFAQNLNYGNFIETPNHMTNDTVHEKYCYDDNELNCIVYGGLYMWREAMDYVYEGQVQGFCPPGWHIPSMSEWQILIDHLGGEEVAGGKMKEAGFAHWDAPNTGASNLSGFTALGGGSKLHVGGVFAGQKNFGWFWSSDQYESYNKAWYIRLNHDKENVENFGTHEYWYAGYSVRCIKD